MRIKISGDAIRRDVVEEMRENSGKSFVMIRKELGLSRSSFDRYRGGKSLIPEKIFSRLVKLCDARSARKVFVNIERLPDNSGQIKGGRRAYRVTYEKFVDGRKKGAVASGKFRRIDTKNFTTSFTLSSEFCEVIGAFIGDGFFNSYRNKLYQVEFAGDSRYDLPFYDKVIIPLIKSVIPEIRPHIYKVEPGNAVRIVFYSKKFFFLLKDFFGFNPGVKTHTINIPYLIKDKGDEYLRRTIRGIFDTDGGVFLDKRPIYKNSYPRIIFQTVSKPLYLQLVNYLGMHFDLYTRLNRKRQIYIIEIYGIQQLRRWMSLIGFSNERHLNRIKSVLQ